MHIMAASADTQRIAALEAERKHMATKADIGDLRTDLEKLRTDLERLRTDFVAFRAEVKAELKTMRWFISIGVPASIAITGIIVGIVVQLINQA